MVKRAAICVGINRPAGMTPLPAAARDAARFEQWARSQGCDTALKTDDNGKPVWLSDIVDLAQEFAERGIYDELIVYFAGHGILLAPGAEYWLLSGAPADPSEAINVLRSIEGARDSAIPRVSFVSDACRSAADSLTLRAVNGGAIFSLQASSPHRSEVDVYYAMLPGDPANEVLQAAATSGHKSLFSSCLPDAPPIPPLNEVWAVLKHEAYATPLQATPRVQEAKKLAVATGMYSEIERVKTARGCEKFETRTGFSVHGARVVDVFSRWQSDPPFQEKSESRTYAFADHVRVYPPGDDEPASILITLDTGTTVLLAICPGLIGSVLVEAGRVISVNYTPSAQSMRFPEYQEHADRLEQMKAYAAFASRHGKFELPDESADVLANRIRQFGGLDPTMGVYAAYGYAQGGRYEDALSVLRYMRDDIEIPIPFDVAMLGLRANGESLADRCGRIAPFGPMLSQGWALLNPNDKLWRPIHPRLRPYLVPGLFVMLDRDGNSIARAAIRSGEVR